MWVKLQASEATPLAEGFTMARFGLSRQCFLLHYALADYAALQVTTLSTELKHVMQQATQHALY